MYIKSYSDSIASSRHIIVPVTLTVDMSVKGIQIRTTFSFIRNEVDRMMMLLGHVHLDSYIPSITRDDNDTFLLTLFLI